MGLVSNTDFESNFTHMAGPINRIYMERTYEEFYLNVFWEEYHCLYPIIEETDFWNYHRSLWDKSQKFRKPSALVDIILAICLQHGTTTVRLEGRPKALADKTDEIIASRWFYRRSQSLLTNHLETPSVMTLHTHILAVIYLSNANSQNAAHSILAIAIRTGIILGLHLEPPDHLPEQQREARKRLWWLLYALEMKFAMELGRPLAVNISQVTCGLPSDETFAYTTVQQKTILSKEAAFLSFSVHFVRLMLATRAIYITFYDECAAVLGQNKQKRLYETPPALERCAEYLLSKMQYAEKWLREVPDALKISREAGGVSFSIDQSRLKLGPGLPRWQQQQSVFLELHYHNMMMSLYRPFICFPPPNDSVIPKTDSCAEKCLQHAQAMTNIIHQCLEDNKLLKNHHEAFRWQWVATLALVGYAMAYPTNSGSSGALTSIQASIKVFEILGQRFAISLLAKQTTEELLARVCTLSQSGIVTASASTSTLLQAPLAAPPTQSLELSSHGDPDFELEFTSTPSNLLMSSNLGTVDLGDRFAWGQNFMSDDFTSAYSTFSPKTTAFSTAPVPWSSPSRTGDNGDDDFFALLNVPVGGDEYGLPDFGDAL